MIEILVTTEEIFGRVRAVDDRSIGIVSAIDRFRAFGTGAVDAVSKSSIRTEEEKIDERIRMISKIQEIIRDLEQWKNEPSEVVIADFGASTCDYSVVIPDCVDWFDYDVAVSTGVAGSCGASTFIDAVWPAGVVSANSIARPNPVSAYYGVVASACSRLLVPCAYVAHTIESLIECLELEQERLITKQKQLRALRKAKTERVSAMIRSAWKHRNDDVRRSHTGAISDPMALNIPTPPTALAAMCSLERGGVVVAFSC